MTTPAPGYVIEAVIRVPDSATAEWVVRQVAALLAERTDGAALDCAGIFAANVYDAPGEYELVVEGAPV